MAMTNEINGNKRDDANFFIRVLKFVFPWKGDKLPDVMRKFVFIASIVAFCIAGKMLWEYANGTTEQEQLQETLTSMWDSVDREPTEPVDSTEDAPKEILAKFLPFLEINADTVGYLKIPGITDSDGKAIIEYPVTQTTDNNFYLDKDFNKQPSSAGWVYADYKIPMTAEGTADNVTLYGHNMASGKFFHHLHDYKGGWGAAGSTYNPSAGLEVIKAANVIQFDTLYVESDWVIYACFLTGIKESQDNGNLFRYHTVRNFADQAAFDDFYSNVMKRSLYLNDEIDCNIDDDYLTLSTCSGEFTDSRFVVCARKLRDGETAEQYQSSYYLNPDPWLPYVLYQVYPGLGTPNH